jgi:hypothetical protein
MDRDADDVVTDELDLAGMNRGPDRTPSSRAESTIFLAQRTARAAPSKTTSEPSPVVLISRPRNV